MAEFNGTSPVQQEPLLSSGPATPRPDAPREEYPLVDGSIFIDQSGITIRRWSKKRQSLLSVDVPVDNVIGCVDVAASTTSLSIIELYEPHGGRICTTRDVVPTRKKRDYRIQCRDAGIAEEVVAEVRRVAVSTQRVLVILNPHSGNGKATRYYTKHIRPLLLAAGVKSHAITTAHSGHAVGIGKQFVFGHQNGGYDGVMVLAGDGTVHEFMAGLLSRPDGPSIATCVPLCSIPCGTQNALAAGLRTVDLDYATWCVIKCRTRRLDGIRVSNGEGKTSVALCGVGWGIAADIARESERYRYLGRARYALLKLKHGVAVGLGIRRYRAALWYSNAAPDEVKAGGVTPLSSVTVASSAAGYHDTSSSAGSDASMLGVGVLDGTPLHGHGPSSRSPAGTQSSITTSIDAPKGSPVLPPDERLEIVVPDLVECSRNCAKCRCSTIETSTPTPAAIHEEGMYVTVGVVNTTPDARFGHASDGFADVIVARKGGPISTLGLLLRYVGRMAGVADERHSKLYSYAKARRVVVTPHDRNTNGGCNIDGEFMPGPGPFTLTAMPSAFCAYGEY